MSSILQPYYLQIFLLCVVILMVMLVRWLVREWKAAMKESQEAGDE